MKKLTNLAILATVALGAMSASASFVDSGDPYPIGSWAQRFKEDGVGNFTQVETFFRSGAGGPFEANGFVNFSVGTWSVDGFGANVVVASGPALAYMEWDIKFLGSSTSPLKFDFYAWDGLVRKEATRATWSGGGWSFAPIAVDDPYLRSSPTVVPEPATILAGAMLLLPFGMSTLRILRKARTA